MKEMAFGSPIAILGSGHIVMRLHWLSIGILAASAALLAQSPPPSANDGPADEPGRAVARLGILNGDASVRRGDSAEPVAAVVNAPLMSGDELIVAANGRAEVQLDAAHFMRLAGDTDVRLADLENGHFQVQLAHGLITWRVLRESQSQAEISTPLVSVHPGPQSVVRVEVMPDGMTQVTVRHGVADVSTQKGTEQIRENSAMLVRGAENDPEFQIIASAARDEWDNWSDQRDNYLLRAQSPRYVPNEVSGAEDLDANGNWNYDGSNGWVWSPTVAPGWAPYQNGRWVWEDYYGWTWVDNAPWGWAPFHYGYWYNRVGFGWCWYPGLHGGHTWWRPAMVGFFGWGGGGFGVGFGFGNVGWVPLAPHEAFHPWYGRGGFNGRSSVNVNIVRNTNVYNSYRNAGVSNGITAVSVADFQRGNFRNNVAVDRGQLQQASLVHGAVPMTPTNQNLRFSDRAPSAQIQRGVTSPSSSRFFGAASANTNDVQRTPFTRQQASVRQAFSQGQTQVSPRMQSSPQASPESRGASPGWDRFQGSSGPNATSPGIRGENPGANSGANAAPGWNRFNVPQNGARESIQSNPGAEGQFRNTPRGQYQQAPQRQSQQAPQGQYEPRQHQQAPQSQYQQPRQFQQVAPPIVRERPAAPQMQSRPAPAQSGGGGYHSAPAQRSAPPSGGSRQSGGEHNGRR
jgi:hypothetical protein